jgi:hypothetical protein
MEKHYTFIKNNRVENTLVFAERNDALAQTISDEQGYDSFIWLDTAAKPALWSTYNGTSFTLPTDEYLISIGMLRLNPEVTDE